MIPCSMWNQSENTLRCLKEMLDLKYDLRASCGWWGPLSPPSKDLVFSSGRSQAVLFDWGYCQDAHLSISDETLQYWPEKGPSPRLSSPNLGFNPFPLPKREKTSSFPAFETRMLCGKQNGVSGTGVSEEEGGCLLSKPGDKDSYFYSNICLSVCFHWRFGYPWIPNSCWLFRNMGVLSISKMSHIPLFGCELSEVQDLSTGYMSAMQQSAA